MDKKPAQTLIWQKHSGQSSSLTCQAYMKASVANLTLREGAGGYFIAVFTSITN